MSANESFHYKQNTLFSFGPHLLGLIFVVVGIATACSPLFVDDRNSTLKALLVGGAALLFGSLVLLSYPGVYFDFKGMRFKSYYALAGIKNGRWQSLEAVASVKVFLSTFTTDSKSNGINPQTPVTVSNYQVTLYSSLPRPVVTLVYPRKDDAVYAAQYLAQALTVPLDMQL